jgi:hypothetical protein
MPAIGYSRSVENGVFGDVAKAHHMSILNGTSILFLWPCLPHKSLQLLSASLAQRWLVDIKINMAKVACRH